MNHHTARGKAKKVSKIIYFALLWFESNGDESLAHRFEDKVTVKRKVNNLNVKTKLTHLLDLINEYKRSPKYTEPSNYGIPLDTVENLKTADIGEALNILKEHGLFVEDKIARSGSPIWRFTLEFESQNIEENLKNTFVTEGEDLCYWDNKETEYRTTRLRDREIYQPPETEKTVILQQQRPHPIQKERAEKLIGRDNQLEELNRLLSFECQTQTIAIHGLGGVGKRALAAEAGYRCLDAIHTSSEPNASFFNAVIFVTFRETRLDLDGERSYSQSRQSGERKIYQIFRAISSKLDNQSITRSIDKEEQENNVIEVLSDTTCLLILDGFQFVSDDERNEILNFLDNLPPSTKCIITTRKRIERRDHYVISLEELREEDSLNLIRQEANRKATNITQENAKKLFDCFGGIPLFLILCIGRINNGSSVEGVLSKFRTDKPKNFKHMMVSFIFPDSNNIIKDDPTFSLLSAISIFSHPPTKESAIEVSGLNSHSIEDQDNYWTKLRQLSLVTIDVDNRCKMNVLIRECIRTKLEDNHHLENEMVNRWAEYYQKFSERYGGIDWAYWHRNYDALELEWENILSVLNWHKNSSDYTAVKKLWNCVNHFADLYGHWDERLRWLDWLIENARVEGDKAYLLCRKGWTLTMKGESQSLMEAEEILEEAWLLNDNMKPSERDYLFHNMVVLLIRLGRYEYARTKLSEKEENYRLVQLELSDDRKVKRCFLNTLRSKAKILFKEGNLVTAKELYEEFIQEADDIEWKRGFCYGLNQLADIAIEQDDLESAKKYLKKGRPVAKRNRNKRRLAFYHKSQALLEKKLGRTDAAKQEFKNARKLFFQIGMRQEVKAVNDLLSNLPLD
jgi:tetratricopeptide (TPR) repeat protein